MHRISPLTRTWVSTVWGSFWVAALVLTIVASLLLAAQLILRAPIVPRPMDLLSIWLCLLPETVGILAPAALLLAIVVVGRRWTDAGDMMALCASGSGPATLLRPTLLMGVGIACAVALCAQVLGPMGRSWAHSTVASAAEAHRIRPGSMVELGGLWIRVGHRSEQGLHEGTLVGNEWLARAPLALRNEGGGLELLDGMARGIDSEWSMTFDSASIDMGSSAGQIHNFARSQASLQALIKRMESKGKDASRERLTLYKRTTLPLVTPLLAILGLPIGLRLRRPYLTAVALVLVLWALQRMGDHGAMHWGPEVVAVFPLVIVCIVLIFSWGRWVR